MEAPNQTEYFFCLTDQSQPIQLSSVLRSGGEQVDSGGGQIAVAQHIGQLHHIVGTAIKRLGEQVPQVVGEHLFRRDSRCTAQCFHFRPDLFSGNRLTASGEKHLARGDFLFFSIL